VTSSVVLRWYIGAIDKAIAECGEGRTDAAVADSLAGREPEPALQNIDEINAAFGAPTVAEILSRVTVDLTRPSLPPNIFAVNWRTSLNGGI
jgi:hypothetical protein